MHNPRPGPEMLVQGKDLNMEMNKKPRRLTHQMPVLFEGEYAENHEQHHTNTTTDITTDNTHDAEMTSPNHLSTRSNNHLEATDNHNNRKMSLQVGGMKGTGRKVSLQPFRKPSAAIRKFSVMGGARKESAMVEVPILWDELFKKGLVCILVYFLETSLHQKARTRIFS